MVYATDLRKQTVEELKQAHTALSKEIFELSSELSISRKLDKPHLLKQKKKDRARVLTILKEKSLLTSEEMK